ncbi:hypothetical protein [Candidatus Magnetaquicoccus inordinatus]|uniref:hypothetical protein n=1 Tax=Candidatus Magnetaquicoccus inordinatus TaxID=2496818 RepID=UPI001D0E959F|nr:hypothetical protein [Candidatus Magnetaquicoccus inordinatus]
MMTISPFANDTQSMTIGGLTIENHEDRVVVYGDIDLTRDKAGLAQARRLKELVDGVVRYLEKATDLPDSVQLSPVIDEVDNPFA